MDTPFRLTTPLVRVLTGGLLIGHTLEILPVDTVTPSIERPRITLPLSTVFLGDKDTPRVLRVVGFKAHFLSVDLVAVHELSLGHAILKDAPGSRVRLWSFYS